MQNEDISQSGGSGVRGLLRASAWKALSVLYGNRLIRRGNAEGRRVALTFDDGPDPEHTCGVLDALAAYDAKATFFVVGECALAHPEIVRRIHAEGHLVACHTQTHTNLGRVPFGKALDECRKGRATLEAIIGKPVRRLRPPFGGLRLLNSFAVLGCGMGIVLWSLDSQDCRGVTPAALCENASRAVPGDILLFHDPLPNTVAALPTILADLRARNMSCVALESLLQRGGLR